MRYELEFKWPFRTNSVIVNVNYIGTTKACYKFRSADSVIYIDKTRLSIGTKLKLRWTGAYNWLNIKVSSSVALSLGGSHGLI